MYKVPSGVSVLSFDIWATLLRGNKSFSKPRLQLIFDMLGHPGIDPDALRAAYLKADRFYNDYAEVMGLDYGMADRLDIMFQELGIDDVVPNRDKVKEIQAAVTKLRLKPEYMPSFIEPDLPETLSKLRDQGYTLGLLSNTGMDDADVMVPVLREVGIWHFFTVAIFSSDHGLAKPNPELFLRTVKAFHVEPKEVLHIGDNANADYRAHEAGLHSVVFSPKGHNLPHIRSMKELLG